MLYRLSTCLCKGWEGIACSLVCKFLFKLMTPELLLALAVAVCLTGRLSSELLTVWSVLGSLMLGYFNQYSEVVAGIELKV